MKILVCIKQVPDLESRFQADATGTWFAENDLAFRINEYDEYAIEQAVRLAEQLGGGAAEITVLSIGPDRVTESLKKALAMGCDRAVQIRDTAAHLKDPWQIASLIATFAKDQGYDLVFTGMQSQDRGSAQVGVAVAELLELSCCTTLVGFEFADGVVTARRELEGGLKAVVQLALPALVTCQLGLNEPRYPTLPNIMKAKKKELLVVPVAELQGAEALTATLSFHAPAKKGGGIVLEGDMADQVSRLYQILKEKSCAVR